MYTVAALTAILATALAAPHTLATRGTYTSYNGDGSAANGWPAKDKWISFDDMWKANLQLITSSCGPYQVDNTTPAEANDLKNAITSVAGTQYDPRVVLAIVMQESLGCVRVWQTTSPGAGVNNPGLMQDHNGSHKCNSATAASGAKVSDGPVLTPCPSDQITGMIHDGLMGTPDGPGIGSLMDNAKGDDAQKVYIGARMYNAGSNPQPGDLAAPGATPSYCSDVANRLMGVVFDKTSFVKGAASAGSAAPATPAAPAAPATPAAPAAGGACAKPYTVKAGDSCWSIGSANGVANLAALNPSVNCSLLKPGDSLCLA